jgi:hypothetical protein
MKNLECESSGLCPKISNCSARCLKEVGGGPKAIDISKPDTGNILKKLRSIERDRAKKYRQQGGQ